MSHRDDHDDLPEPDAPPSASERARAESFARHVDDLLGGRPAPPLMDADDRELVEVATVVKAGHGGLELSAERRAALITDVLGQVRAGRSASPAPTEAPAPGGGGGAIDLDARRARRGPRRRVMDRALPWTLATVAAAAALFLFVTRPQPSGAPADAHLAPAAPVAPSLPVELRSRSADPLVGRIPRAAAGDARARIDVIHADRLSGYRTAYLDRRAPAAPGGAP